MELDFSEKSPQKSVDIRTVFLKNSTFPRSYINSHTKMKEDLASEIAILECILGEKRCFWEPHKLLVDALAERSGEGWLAKRRRNTLKSEVKKDLKKRIDKIVELMFIELETNKGGGAWSRFIQ